MQLRPHEGVKDKRVCYLCNSAGDGDQHVTSRLLNFNVDAWVHLNCALWSSEVSGVLVSNPIDVYAFLCTYVSRLEDLEFQ